MRSPPVAAHPVINVITHERGRFCAAGGRGIGDIVCIILIYNHVTTTATTTTATTTTTTTATTTTATTTLPSRNSNMLVAIAQLMRYPWGRVRIMRYPWCRVRIRGRIFEV